LIATSSENIAASKRYPAEHAWIKLDLGKNKIECLIRTSSKNGNIPYK